MEFWLIRQFKWTEYTGICLSKEAGAWISEQVKAASSEQSTRTAAYQLNKEAAAWNLQQKAASSEQNTKAAAYQWNKEQLYVILNSKAASSEQNTRAAAYQLNREAASWNSEQ